MSTKYKIGQVLYVLSSKSQQLIPMQICEINQRTTIEGEEIFYVVLGPNDKGPYDLYNLLEQIEGEVYINPSEASKFLKESANKAVDHMINLAIKKAAQEFGEADNTSIDLFEGNNKTTNKRKPGRPLKSSKSNNKNNSNIQSNKPDEDELETQVVGKDGQLINQKLKIRSVSMGGEAN